MQLAFSTNAYLNYSFAEAVARLAGDRLSAASRSWPTCRMRGRRILLPEQKQAHPRRARQQPARDLEHQRLHDARGQRSAPEVLASVVDRAGRQLPPHPHRPHEACSDAGEGTRRDVHHHRARRAGRAGQSWKRLPEAVRRDAQAGRRARGEGRRAAARRAGAGAAHRDGGSVSGIRVESSRRPISG